MIALSSMNDYFCNWSFFVLLLWWFLSLYGLFRDLFKILYSLVFWILLSNSCWYCSIVFWQSIYSSILPENSTCLFSFCLKVGLYDLWGFSWKSKQFSLRYLFRYSINCFWYKSLGWGWTELYMMFSKWFCFALSSSSYSRTLAELISYSLSLTANSICCCYYWRRA